MRALILAAGASLIIAGCGKQDEVVENTTADQGFAANDISSNDTTAIDAATNDAAEMAEDVEFEVDNLDNAAGNGDAETNRSGNSAGNSQ